MIFLQGNVREQIVDKIRMGLHVRLATKSASLGPLISCLLSGSPFSAKLVIKGKYFFPLNCQQDRIGANNLITALDSCPLDSSTA